MLDEEPMKTIITTLLVLLTGCAVTNHDAKPGALGSASSTEKMTAQLSEPGIVELETVNSADWAVPLSGLLNLDNPIAKDAGMVDGDEPIQVFFHVITHPTRGTFIVDTGVATAFRDDPKSAHVSGLVMNAMHLEKLKVHAPLGEWLTTHPKLSGVFVTHLHLDHVMGMRDVPADTPVYVGPGESKDSQFMYLFVQGTTNALLEGKPSLSEWPFEQDPTGAFDGVVDIFGDGSVWALSVPGHTRSSVAFLVRTKSGPVLLTGDASHTRWGWEHHVEPGTFTGDAKRGRESLDKLHAYVEAHPEIEVRFGHTR